MIREQRATATRVKKGRIGLSVLALLVLFAAVAVSFVIRQSEVIAAKNRVAELEAQIEHYKVANAALLDQVEALKSDEYIEKTAREKLGLVMPGEVQYMMVTYKNGGE